MSSIADYQQLAQQKLPAEVWRYLSDGAGAGRTMAANHAALNDTSLMTRPLADVSAGHTRSKLFGQDYAHPLLLAPITYQRQFHADGELAAAMAVEAQGAPYIVSSLARMTIDSIARSGAALCFQLYWQGSRGETLFLLRKAVAAGCKAIVFTVDAPVKQASFNLSPGISAVNLEAPIRMPALAEGQSEVFDYWMARAPRWPDLVWLREQTQLPLLIKACCMLMMQRRPSPSAVMVWSSPIMAGACSTAHRPACLHWLRFQRDLATRQRSCSTAVFAVTMTRSRPSR